jgi:hypothetical protein
MRCPYSANVNFKRNVLRGGAILILIAPALLTSGCGGFAATKSVSPATFLLPGFGQADPRPASSDLPERFEKSSVVAAVASEPVR